MANSADDTTKRRNRLSKPILIIIAIGCLCFGALPSVSKYALVNDEATNYQYQSLPSSASVNEAVVVAVGDKDEGYSRKNDAKRSSQLKQFDDLLANARPPFNTTSHHLQMKDDNSMHEHTQHSIHTTTNNFTTDIDLVSLTISSDFFILFNNSAITSWIKYIQNIRSITFIGPPNDYELFQQNMNIHYPHLLPGNNNNNVPLIPIHWVNETHWKDTYKKKYRRCVYPSVCQQLIKLYVFDLRTHLGLDYIGNNVLIVDSDTVWSRNATFVHPNGKAQYWEVTGTTYDGEGTACTGMDPVKFTEAITIGSSHHGGPRKPTLTPYTACARPEYPNATGARHIVHHMLFQYDVMMHLHRVIRERWDATELWQAFIKCHGHNFCDSRIAEYELYYSFVTTNYAERVRVDTLTNTVDYMGGSAICSAEEMKCCEEQGVLLKGCHDHRIRKYNHHPFESNLGDMCKCTESLPPKKQSNNRHVQGRMGKDRVYL